MQVYKINTRTLNISYAERKIFGKHFWSKLILFVVIFDLNNTLFEKC